MEILKYYFLDAIFRGYLTYMSANRHSNRLLYVNKYILHMMQCVRFSLVSYTRSAAQRQDYSFK